MTQKILLPLLVFVLSIHMGYAQFTVKTIPFYIVANTPVHIDSLVLIPGDDLEIKNNSLIISREPVTGTLASSIKRVYQWTDAPLGFNGGEIGFYLNPTPDELNSIPQDELQLAFSPNLDNNFMVSSSSISDVGNNYLNENSSAVPWQQLTAARIGSTLPLKLLSFTADIAGHKVGLAWRVAQESGVETYAIMRSTDGNNFYPIGSLAAACNGCQKDFNYSFMDDNPDDGFNFYRLQIIESDGHVQYSDVVRVDFDRGLSILVSPNPAQTEIHLSGLSVEKQYQLSVYNTAGQQIYKQSGIRNTNKLKVNVVDWPSGIYFIHLSDNENNNYRLKVVRK